MLTGLWAFLLGSPLKLAFWIGNRLVTWTGLLVLWRKIQHAPDRVRRFLLWGAILNAVSLLVLVGLLRLLTYR